MIFLQNTLQCALVDKEKKNISIPAKIGVKTHTQCNLPSLFPLYPIQATTKMFKLLLLGLVKSIISRENCIVKIVFNEAYVRTINFPSFEINRKIPNDERSPTNKTRQRKDGCQQAPRDGVSHQSCVD